MMYQNANKGATGISEWLLGPVFAPSAKLAGNLPALFTEDDFRERELVNFTKRFVPGGNLWPTALAFERLVTDTVIEAVDPKAHDYFRNRKKYAKEEGTEYWAPPGENLFESLEDATR
jgi:hypothetical protein